MKWYFNDFNVVKIGMMLFMLKKWCIGKVYVDVYYQFMYDFFIGIVDDKEFSFVYIFEISSFFEKYYKKMFKIGFCQDDFSLYVIDNCEGELVWDFCEFIIKFFDEWIECIFVQEKCDFFE